MKIILLATAFAITAYAAPTDEWNQYKAKYKKVYTSETENTRRLEQYLKSKKMVEEHNRKYDRGETSYTMGINQFSDWFPEELNRLNGLKPREPGSRGKPLELPSGTVVPDSINWVTKGAVTSVKDEGRCDCSYAFSAAAALEALMFIKNGTKTDLSVQEVLDCSQNHGCRGGNVKTAFGYIMEHGIKSNESYPYEETQKECRAKNGTKAAYCTDFIVMYDENQLKEIVGTVVPVTVPFAVGTTFIHYKSGIFDGDCVRERNHYMLAVGYGTDEKTKADYWLLKNSWGTKWGEKGYARVIRNKNKCQMALSTVYPV